MPRGRWIYMSSNTDGEINWCCPVFSDEKLRFLIIMTYNNKCLLFIDKMNAYWLKNFWACKNKSWTRTKDDSFSSVCCHDISLSTWSKASQRNISKFSIANIDQAQQPLFNAWQIVSTMPANYPGRYTSVIPKMINYSSTKLIFCFFNHSLSPTTLDPHLLMVSYLLWECLVQWPGR